jgi:hypothetical protein
MTRQTLRAVADMLVRRGDDLAAAAVLQLPASHDADCRLVCVGDDCSCGLTEEEADGRDHHAFVLLPGPMLETCARCGRDPRNHVHRNAL